MASMASTAGPIHSQAHARVPCWRHVCTAFAAVLVGGGLLLSSFVFGFESTALEPRAVPASVRTAAQVSPGGRRAEGVAPGTPGIVEMSTTAPRHQVLIEESTFNDLFEPRNVTTEIEEAILRDEARLAEALELRQAAQSSRGEVTTASRGEGTGASRGEGAGAIGEGTGASRGEGAGASGGADKRTARRPLPRAHASEATEAYTVAGTDVAKRGKGGCSLANLKPIKRKYCLTSVGHKRDCPQCPANARCMRQRWCCFRFVCVCEQRFSKPTFDGTELVRCGRP